MSHADPDAGRGTVPALGAYFIIPALACALTVYFLVSTRDLIWEARSTGTFIGVILLGLCIGQFIRLGLKVSRGEATLGLGELAENTYYNRLRLALLVLTIAFIALLPVIGTTLGLFLVLIAMVRLMGVRSWRALVTVAFITSATVHGLLIYLLGSQLPQGLLKPLFTSLGI
jgi:ABC-type sugar transport system permease subunit